MELWISIDGFSNYEASSDGRIRNRTTRKILRPNHNQKGYQQVSLYKDGKPYTKKVHRLVADAFYDGEHIEQQVNHINGDKDDNHVYNLEWCNGSENIKHAYDSGLKKPPSMKRVKIIENGAIFDSMSDCARSINGTVSGVHDCKTGKQTSHRGYHFEFL